MISTCPQQKLEDWSLIETVSDVQSRVQHPMGISSRSSSQIAAPELSVALKPQNQGVLRKGTRGSSNARQARRDRESTCHFSLHSSLSSTANNTHSYSPSCQLTSRQQWFLQSKLGISSILVYKKNETVDMLVLKSIPVWIELFSHLKTFFCSNKIQSW